MEDDQGSDDKHHFCPVSLLDFSELEKSKLFLSKSDVPLPHTEDERHLQSIIRHRMDNDEENKKEQDWVAELTEYPVSLELQQSFLKIYIHYREKVLVFDKCRYNIVVTGLIVKTLVCLEPMDLSCSWLESNPEDYALKIGNRKEYLFNHHVSISSLVYVRDSFSRGEKIEFTLIEKSNIDSFSSSVFNDLDTSTQNEGLPPTIPQSPNLSYNVRTEMCHYSNDIQSPLYLNINKIEGITPEILSDFTPYASYEDIIFTVEIEIKKFIEPIKISSIKGEDIGKDLHLSIPLPLFICDLPREAFLKIRLYAQRENTSFTQRFFQTWIFMESRNPVKLGWGECSIFDFQGCLRSHLVQIPLWRYKETPFEYYTPAIPSNEEETVKITFSFSIANISKPIIFSPGNTEDKGSTKFKIKPKDLEKIKSGKASDTLLWKYRKLIRNKYPNLLISLLKTVNWDDKEHLTEIYDILKDYPLIYPFAGFEILALESCDIQVREYAVKCLHSLSNKEIQECMPQLIQSLKLDIYLSSSLTIFMLMRALKNRSVGHTFYWYLVSEMDNPVMEKRFHVLKQRYLENIDSTERRALIQMEKVMNKLIRIAQQVQSTNGISDEQLKSYLYEIKFPEKFYLPTNSKIEMTKLEVEDCFILKSNAQPLWLSFEDINHKKVYIILKVGDDMRIDVLALQMMKILDSFWKKEGLDLHLQPYVALPLGRKVGLIEVASKSETTSSINWKYGGNSFASAFSSTSLKAYLYKNNPPQEREQALRNFALSCAGYCVFTYVFGVGDRHGDNILCTKKGNVFHIDFGYFLGERSKILGFSRETNFFVLTLNYINAMDKFFKLFVTLSCQGFVIAQRYESTFTTLIKLMQPCGRDVLSEDQIKYVKRSLEPWLSEKEGQRKFYNIIQRSLGDKRTLLNDFAHLLATKNRS